MQNHSNNSTFEYVKYQVPLSGDYFGKWHDLKN